ncbi:MAG: sialidase family protein [Acidimicrobiales bacterium]
MRGRLGAGAARPVPGPGRGRCLASGRPAAASPRWVALIAGTLAAGALAAGTLTPPAWAQASPASGSVSAIVNARPLSIAEAAAAQSRRGTVVVATNGLTPGPASITAWSRPRGSAAWTTGVAVRPAGFSASYDPAVTALPGGAVAVVGVATVGGQGACLPQSSVYLATTGSHGLTFGTPVVVDDRRQGGGFDDRPYVAAGPGGRLWVAWSHGTPADQCQVVGASDQVQLATSNDGGHDFSTPVTLPRATEGAAFGVQIAPLGNGRAAVSWAELAGGQVTIVMSLVRADGSYTPPQVVATHSALPRLLHGASFYSFSLPSLASFDHGRDLALAWPVWQDGVGQIVVAESSNLGRSWSTTSIAPGPGSDLLLPALAAEGPNRLRLLFADHTRAGDVVAYQTLLATVTPATGAISLGPVTTAVAGRTGPGFKELGEFTLLNTSAHAVVGAVVDGGSANATLDFLHWPVTGAPAGPATTSPSTTPTTPATAPPTTAASPASSLPPPSTSSASTSSPTTKGGTRAAGGGSTKPVSSRGGSMGLLGTTAVALVGLVVALVLAVAAAVVVANLAGRSRRRARSAAKRGSSTRRPAGERPASRSSHPVHTDDRR